MTYVLFEIWMCLFAAAILGLLAGWLIWGRELGQVAAGYRAKLNEAVDDLTRATARAEELETRLASSASAASSSASKVEECEERVAALEARLAAATPTPAMHLEYETYKSDKDGQYYFRFFVPDGRVVLRSEGYTRSANSEKGLRSVIRNASREDRIQKKTSKDGRYFFDVFAPNHEIVGTSTLFRSSEERDAMIALFAEGERVLHRVGDADRTVSTSLKAPSSERDDLKTIPGIGPELESLLNERGIYRYRQIARWTKSDVDDFSSQLDELEERVESDRWIEGARVEHRRKYGEDA